MPEITHEQWELLEQHRIKWFNVGVSCQPANYTTAEVAISEMYKQVGSPLPTFIRLNGPFDCLTIKSSRDREIVKDIREQFRDQLLVLAKGQLVDQLGIDIWNQLQLRFFGKLKFQLQEQLGLKLRSHLQDFFGSLDGRIREAFWGQQASYCSGAYLSLLDIGAKYDSRLYDGLRLWESIATSIGWWWPYKDVCLLSARHERCCLEYDSNVGLHCTDGPALQFVDGYKIYAINGSIIK